MSTYSNKPDAGSDGKLTDQGKNLVDDVTSEVKHEAHSIHTVKEPVDPTHSDHVVRRHVAGLSISFFVVIGLFLVAVIAGITIYTHLHH